MAVIYSTLANDNAFHQYDGNKRVAKPVKTVVVPGKAGVQNKKNLITPRGVAMNISAEDLAFLRTHDAFNRMVDRGHIVVDEKGRPTDVYSADKKAGEMERDKSSQDNAKTLKASGKKEPKTSKDDTAQDSE